MAKNILQERLSKEQVILDEIYRKNADIPTTIEEIKQKTFLPRTTIVEQLNILEESGLLIKKKEGKTLQYFPVPEISKQLREALEKLQSAYAFALTFVQQKRLQQLESLTKKK